MQSHRSHHAFLLPFYFFAFEDCGCIYIYVCLGHYCLSSCNIYSLMGVSMQVRGRTSVFTNSGVALWMSSQCIYIIHCLACEGPINSFSNCGQICSGERDCVAYVIWLQCNMVVMMTWCVERNWCCMGFVRYWKIICCAFFNHSPKFEEHHFLEFIICRIKVVARVINHYKFVWRKWMHIKYYFELWSSNNKNESKILLIFVNCRA